MYNKIKEEEVKKNSNKPSLNINLNRDVKQNLLDKYGGRGDENDEDEYKDDDFM